MQWKHFHGIKQAKKYMGLRAIAFMRNEFLSKAWNAMKDGINAQVRRRERTQMVNNIVAIMVNRTMLAAWNAWRADLEHNAIKQDRMRQAAKRFIDASMCAAWTSWMQFVIYQRGKAAKEEHAQTFNMTKTQARTWNTWRESSTKALVDRGLLEKTLTFIRHKASSITLILALMVLLRKKFILILISTCNGGEGYEESLVLMDRTRCGSSSQEGFTPTCHIVSLPEGFGGILELMEVHVQSKSVAPETVRSMLGNCSKEQVGVVLGDLDTLCQQTKACFQGNIQEMSLSPQKYCHGLQIEP